MKRRIYSISSILAVLLICMLALFGSVTAQENNQAAQAERTFPDDRDDDDQDDDGQPPPDDGQLNDFRYQYAAKFICFDNAQFGSDAGLVPGVYLTDVNIHNGGYNQVNIRKKLALAYPPGQQEPGPISEWVSEQLDADEALEVNCYDQFNFPAAQFSIQAAQPGTALFRKGFLVIQSTEPLDVAAVYTAGGSPDNGNFVGSIDVENIPQREISGQ